VNDDPMPAEGGPPAPAGPTEGWGQGWASLSTYLEANAGRFTDEALRSAAVGVGWDPAAVEQALERLHAHQVVAPLRVRANRIIKGLYLAGWALLTVGLTINSSRGGLTGGWGIAALGVGILTVSMLIAYGIGRYWSKHIRVSQALTAVDLALVLSVPVVLWLAVAGICVATGLPIPRAA
jgi:hypothetical protein